MKKIFKKWEFWLLMAAIITIIIMIVIWQFPKQNKTDITQQTIQNEIETKQKILDKSIFDISKEIEEKETMLAKTEDFKKYIGLSVNDTGFFSDLYRSSNNYIVWFKKSTSTTESISCNFDEKWGQILSTKHKGEKIQFEGTINEYFLGISLKDCSLK
jgi:uncharacterized membrane-anchored protein YhcB (DUF1043 family)